VAEVMEEVSNLGGSNAEGGEWRQAVFGEELGVGGFMAVLRRAAREFGEEEKLIGVGDIGRMTVEVAVENSGEFGDADFVAGFFTGFADGSDGGRLADVGPPAGEGPAAVLEFAYEQDAAVLECRDTHIRFGCGVTGLLGKEILQVLGVFASCTCGHHFRGDFSDLLVAVDIEFVFAVGKTGLGDGLKAAGPSKP